MVRSATRPGAHPQVRPRRSQRPHRVGNPGLGSLPSSSGPVPRQGEERTESAGGRRRGDPKTACRSTRAGPVTRWRKERWTKGATVVKRGLRATGVLRFARDTLPVMAFGTHAAVKTLTDAGADEALAVAVAVVERSRARRATEATGELVTRSHFDTALAHLESRLAWRAWSRPVL